ncbi:hypothetical protein F8M41_000136 [Gigaspora margarita]|uniref:Uncharacterized protein n=1 Tax=Gigaspora margarita TaxID=4874 RepID=A0A8H4AZN5_GIGMA|nr:hypothetical protein F8M41_000136 [Gigaspora margarita]
MVTLKKGMPSEYFSPVINNYVTFNAEEFEENKNLCLEFVKSDEINTNAKPYNKQEKKNYMSKLMNFKDVLDSGQINMINSDHLFELAL